MKVFLGGTERFRKHPEQLKQSKYTLESFYSIAEWQIPYLLKCDMFLLDSGAFTFMNSKKGNCDFDEYLTSYINFINKYNVENFFELDIDSIVGYEKVKEMRKRLESETRKQCIPVWHKSRGLDDFEIMCKQYKYAAIGGIVTKEIKRAEYKFLPLLIKMAHENNCKLHGLGFTSTSYYKQINFDTVDSTTWNVGVKYGKVCVFTHDGLMKQLKQQGEECVKRDELMLHNWGEWLKFQKYAELHL